MDSVWNCMQFLQDKPKWKVWQKKEEEDNTKKTKRPLGSEKAKQMSKDCELVEKLTVSDDKKKQSSEKPR